MPEDRYYCAFSSWRVILYEVEPQNPTQNISFRRKKVVPLAACLASQASHFIYVSQISVTLLYPTGLVKMCILPQTYLLTHSQNKHVSPLIFIVNVYFSFRNCTLSSVHECLVYFPGLGIAPVLSLIICSNLNILQRYCDQSCIFVQGNPHSSVLTL